MGILAIEAYFPKLYVSQEELERHDGVSQGKYTIGLGQKNLAYVTDREDIYSVCLSAVQRLLEQYRIPATSIGRLEVATETILDHSKSIKTVLMQLFQESGNTDIEGIDTYNACYGGTAALFNSAAWVESSSWDGRLALVVAGDIAEYAVGPARCTGGCGAVAFLIGPNAPLVLQPGLRASHFEHVYDFFKPNLASPYPVVDGHFSNKCYLRSLDLCYERYCDKYKKQAGSDYDTGVPTYLLFHAPYNKLVQKAAARMLYNDYMRGAVRPEFSDAKLEPFRSVPREQSYDNRDLEQAFVRLSGPLYAEKVAPSTLLPQNIGNTYTASLYAGLVSLIATKGSELAGKQMLLFSYGSGLASSLFSIRAQDSDKAREQLGEMARIVDLSSRLAARTKSDPEAFNKTMAVREALHSNSAEYTPAAPADASTLAHGAFYLTLRDAMGRRKYERLIASEEGKRAAA